MNKFLTFKGEQPVYLGDIDFMQDNSRAAILYVLKGITGENNPTCVVYGCEKTETGCAGGVVCLSGELYAVEPSSLTGDVYLKTATSYAGSRLMKSGEYRECYEINSVAYTSEMTDYELSALPRLEDLLSRGLLVGVEQTGAVSALKVVKRGSMFSVNGLFHGYDKGPGWMPGMNQSVSCDLKNVNKIITGGATVIAPIYNFPEGKYEAAFAIVEASISDGKLTLSFDQWIDADYAIPLSFIIE